MEIYQVVEHMCEEGQKNTWWNNAWKSSKFENISKTTDLVSSLKPKKGMHK